MSRTSFAVLKEKIGAIEGDKAFDYFRSSSIPRGVPKGAIIELMGTAKTEWLAHFFSENAEVRTFWIEDKLTLLPTALSQRGVNLANVCIAHAPENLFKAVRVALRSQVFHCLVLPFVFEEERELKALQLLTEKANATAFVLSQTRSSFWPITAQFEINHGTESPFEIHTHKYKRQGIA